MNARDETNRRPSVAAELIVHLHEPGRFENRPPGRKAIRSMACIFLRHRERRRDAMARCWSPRTVRSPWGKQVRGSNVSPPVWLAGRGRPVKIVAGKRRHHGGAACSSARQRAILELLAHLLSPSIMGFGHAHPLQCDPPRTVRPSALASISRRRASKTPLPLCSQICIHARRTHTSLWSMSGKASMHTASDSQKPVSTPGLKRPSAILQSGH